jgi:hypothetical protein
VADRWIAARDWKQRFTEADLVPFSGLVYNLSVQPSDPNEDPMAPDSERSYVLGRGLAVHNSKAPEVPL